MKHPNARKEWEHIGPETVDRLAYSYHHQREILDVARYSRGIGATMARGFALQEALKQFPPRPEIKPSRLVRIARALGALIPIEKRSIYITQI
jgi:hypothetical protein